MKPLTQEQANHILSQFICHGYMAGPHHMQDAERLRKILFCCIGKEDEKDDNDETSEEEYEVADDHEDDPPILKDMKRLARDIVKLRADFDDWTRDYYK